MVSSSVKVSALSNLAVGILVKVRLAPAVLGQWLGLWLLASGPSGANGSRAQFLQPGPVVLSDGFGVQFQAATGLGKVSLALRHNLHGFRLAIGKRPNLRLVWRATALAGGLQLLVKVGDLVRL